MTLRFATKRNSNGHRNIIIIDTVERTYATDAAHWFCRDDFVEVSKGDLDKIRREAEAENLTRVDFL